MYKSFNKISNLYDLNNIIIDIRKRDMGQQLFMWLYYRK